MRTQTIAGLLFVAALSACSVHQTDPCAGTAGSCLSLRVTGTGKVDALDVAATGAFTETKTSAFGQPESLPVRIAVVPEAGATGTLILTVTGHDGSNVVGAGTSMGITLTGTNDRAEIDIALGAPLPGDGGTEDLAPGGDAAGPQDLSGACTPSTTIGCSTGNGVLLTCDTSGKIVQTTCQFTCASTPAPHCTTFVPHAPVTAAILAAAGAGTPAPTGAFTINTDTGAFGPIRGANADPSMLHVEGGIGFQTLSQTESVFTTGSITFDESTVVKIVGTRPFVLVASTTIAVHGVIDARPYDTNGNLCPTPSATLPMSAGGGVGGVPSSTPSTTAGTGGGAGGGLESATYDIGGGGGGGGANATHAAAGGVGYNGNNALRVAGAGGAEVAFATPIIGGSGGGAGTGMPGGSGGGAVHLVAGESITIGDGGNLTPMGIMVNGCGGTGGMSDYSGGGGGSGGTVLLESPIVTMGAYGAITAHGGGGGASYATTVAMTTSGFTAQPVAGQPAANGYGSGGMGGGGGVLAGGVGGNYGTSTGSNPEPAGGGGGTAGRIVLLNASGTLTLGANGFVSPMMGLMGTGSDAAVVLGQVTTQ